MADEKKEKGPRKPAQVRPDELYMVNPGGAVVLMTKVDAAYRLKWFKNWRRATPVEVAALEKAEGYQTAEHPLCARPALESVEMKLDEPAGPAMPAPVGKAK